MSKPTTFSTFEYESETVRVKSVNKTHTSTTAQVTLHDGRTVWITVPPEMEVVADSSGPDDSSGKMLGGDWRNQMDLALRTTLRQLGYLVHGVNVLGQDVEYFTNKGLEEHDCIVDVVTSYLLAIGYTSPVDHDRCGDDIEDDLQTSLMIAALRSNKVCTQMMEQVERDLDSRGALGDDV